MPYVGLGLPLLSWGLSHGSTDILVDVLAEGRNRFNCQNRNKVEAQANHAQEDAATAAALFVSARYAHAAVGEITGTRIPSHTDCWVLSIWLSVSASLDVSLSVVSESSRQDSWTPLAPLFILPSRSRACGPNDAHKRESTGQQSADCTDAADTCQQCERMEDYRDQQHGGARCAVHHNGGCTREVLSDIFALEFVVIVDGSNCQRSSTIECF